MSWSLRFTAHWVTVGLAVTLGAFILIEVMG
jgi:hypothetical protein